MHSAISEIGEGSRSEEGQANFKGTDQKEGTSKRRGTLIIGKYVVN
jgi:hypothetical protein